MPVMISLNSTGLQHSLIAEETNFCSDRFEYNQESTSANSSITYNEKHRVNRDNSPYGVEDTARERVQAEYKARAIQEIKIDAVD